MERFLVACLFVVCLLEVCPIPDAGAAGRATAAPADTFDLGAHPNLRLWLKADSITGVAAGGPIARWEDSSRGQAHAQQSASSRRPHLVANAVNGLPAVAFDGQLSYLKLPGGSVFGALRDLDVFAVFSKRTSTSYDTLFGANSGADGPLLGTHDGFLTFYNSGSSPSELKSTKIVPLQTFVLAEFFKEVADVQLYLDGTRAATGRMSPTSSGTMGERYVGGDGGSEGFDGEVAELAIFDVALPSEERRAVQCHLARKYGLGAAQQECTTVNRSNASGLDGE